MARNDRRAEIVEVEFAGQVRQRLFAGSAIADFVLDRHGALASFRRAAAGAAGAPGTSPCPKAIRPKTSAWVAGSGSAAVRTRAGEATVRQSLAALFTLPGLPCVYYGTEAGLKGAREDFFDDQQWYAFPFVQSAVRALDMGPTIYAASRIQPDRSLFLAVSWNGIRLPDRSTACARCASRRRR